MKPSKKITNIEKTKDMRCPQREDEWWMSYDSGIPAEDITDEVNKEIEELEAKLKNRI
jgi:hypothetical protein